MKNKLYLECYSGISGDMTVGALLDLGADLSVLEKVLDSIPVQGFKIKVSRVKKAGLDVCDFAVLLDEKYENHDHDMAYLHGERPQEVHSHEGVEHHHEDHYHEDEQLHEGHSHGGEGRHEEDYYGDHHHKDEHHHEDHHHEGDEDYHGDHHHGDEHHHEDHYHEVDEHSHGDHHHGDEHHHEDHHHEVDEHSHGDHHHEDHHHEEEYSHENSHHEGEDHPHGDHHHHYHDAHSHSHSHEHRNLPDILAIIENTDMSARAKELSASIFKILAKAEAKAHGVALEEVHFHEVGALDSIVDIISAAVCIDNLGIEEAIIPVLYEGTGYIRCQHGVIPVPVPAVTNIASDCGLSLHITKSAGEFVTPTGAAIVAAIQTGDELPERFRIKRIGIGAGKREYERASFLRAMLIE